MVNLSDIKDKLIEKKVRKSFKIGKYKVEIYNIPIEEIETVYEKIKDLYSVEDDEFIVNSAEAISYVYSTFTNLQIDEPSDLLEALQQPNSKLKDIQREVSKSMTEVIRSFIKDKIAELDNLSLIMETKELSSKSKKIIKELGVNIEENKQSW